MVLRLSVTDKLSAIDYPPSGYSCTNACWGDYPNQVVFSNRNELVNNNVQPGRMLKLGVVDLVEMLL